MAKAKRNIKKSNDAAAVTTKQDSNQSPATNPGRKSSYTLAELRDDGDLWYKLCVLIYDLYNMTKDKTCENRTKQTTDPQYISTPYFSDDEAALVKSTVLPTGDTVEQAITNELENFFEKRRASGDWRPCGPHTMVPIYLSVFDIDKAEIEDEKFVSRVRRCGVS